MFAKELSQIPGGSAEVAFASIEEGYTFGFQGFSCFSKAVIMSTKVGSGESPFASFDEGYTIGERSGCGSCNESSQE